MSIYRDLKTGDILQAWTSIYTGAATEVFEVKTERSRAPSTPRLPTIQWMPISAPTWVSMVALCITQASQETSGLTIPTHSHLTTILNSHPELNIRAGSSFSPLLALIIFLTQLWLRWKVKSDFSLNMFSTGRLCRQLGPDWTLPTLDGDGFIWGRPRLLCPLPKTLQRGRTAQSTAGLDGRQLPWLSPPTPQLHGA